jgi:hypothetical protein
MFKKRHRSKVTLYHTLPPYGHQLVIYVPCSFSLRLSPPALFVMPLFWILLGSSKPLKPLEAFTMGLAPCSSSATAAALDEELFSCPRARHAAAATAGAGSFLGQRWERTVEATSKKRGSNRIEARRVI